jgi:hypothetical protein
MNKATGPALVWRGWLPGVEFTRWKAIPYAATITSVPAIASAVDVSGNAEEVKIMSLDSDKPSTDATAVSSSGGGGGGNDTERTDEVVCVAAKEEEELENANDRLCRVTLEADRFATVYLSALLAPVVVAFALRSLIYDRHLSWYSWAIGALTSCVYAFGFVLMCPQLYINHSLKSVSHLPWNVSFFLLFFIL